jgi:ATP phosphoribosyltransferase
MESTPRFIANRVALGDPWKRQKIETLVLLLKGAQEARGKVGLKMNIEESRLANLIAALPALRNPTVSHLAASTWVAVETVIDEAVVREIIPQLKSLGAEGIIEYPLNKVVY